MSGVAQDWCARSLAQTLREAAPDAPAMSLEDLLDLHGQGSAAVLLMVLALFSTIPIAGVGTVLSLFILALAWQWRRSHDMPPLPEKLARVSLTPTWSQRCLRLLAWTYEQAARCLRERWTLLHHRATHLWWSGWIAMMGLLILLPLPFGNVLPAISLMLLSLGWMFRDGLALLLSGAVGAGAIGFGLSVSHLLISAAQGLWLRLV
ncbi:MAG: hypothetical protein C4K60_01585 [Ideonella sp. MAG2]|nr:MAG: hypothetical protein C4K60_01585 [Ideonella sp. MAG2]